MNLLKLFADPTPGQATAYLIFSIIASVIICLTYIPGAWKIWKTNDTRGTSLAMYVLCNIACLTWVIAGGIMASYAGILSALGIIFSNSFVFICSSLVLFKKIRFIIQAKKNNMSEYDYVTKIVEETKQKILKN